MKIVWCDQNQQLRIPMSISYYQLQQEIAKIANVSFYGLGGGDFNPELDVTTIIAVEDPDVIVFWSNQLTFRNVDKITNTLKFCKCSDAHSPNFERHIKFLNSNRINYASLAVWESIVEKYRRFCPNVYFFWMPIALDHKVFINKNQERKLDCSFIGSCGADYYPMRVKIINKLKDNPRINFYFKHLETQTVTPEEWNKQLNVYIDLLNSTKITPFSNGIFNYPVQRWYESMACGCLIIAETPLDANSLHFIPNYNYVVLDPNRFEEQILYYLEHDDERLKIVGNAKETFLKYHTMEIRARQLLDQLADPMDF